MDPLAPTVTKTMETSLSNMSQVSFFPNRTDQTGQHNIPLTFEQNFTEELRHDNDKLLQCSDDGWSNLPFSEGWDENTCFPEVDLVRLESLVSRVRWIIPVFPDDVLVTCLRAAILLTRHDLDAKNELYHRLINGSLLDSVTKLMCDEAVARWGAVIFEHIHFNCNLIITLCALKIKDDCLPLLEILGMLIDPTCRYHQSKHTSISTYRLSHLYEGEPFALVKRDGIVKQGRLLDYINRFGVLGGFDKLLDRFQSGKQLTLPVLNALLKPWFLCYEYLTSNTIRKYFVPIITIVLESLDQILANNLQVANTMSEADSCAIMAVTKYVRRLASRVLDNDIVYLNLDALSLKMIRRNLPQCTICMDDISTPKSMLSLDKCQHIFHAHCINDWFNTHYEDTCPICRATVFQSDVDMAAISTIDGAEHVFH